MLFGLDGVEIGLVIVFLTLFAGIMTGFPVAFAIGGAGMISFAIIAALDSAGLLIHEAIDKSSAEYVALVAEGVIRESISVFRYPELPTVEVALFPGGWEQAMERNLSFMVNRMNERVIAGQSIETLLAVLMFVMMGIVLERSKIAEDLLTTMARVFGPLPGGLAVSIVIVGAFLAASTGIVGATVVTMGLLALPTMLRNNYSPELATGVIAASGTLGQIIPPSIVIVLLGTLVGDLYATGQETRAQLAGCTDALTYLAKPAVLSVGTLFQAALLPGLFLALLYGLYAFGFALWKPASAPPVQISGSPGEPVTRNEALTWYLAAPVGLILAVVLGAGGGVIGNQAISVSDYAERENTSMLRTNVSEQCQASMIALHGQEMWDASVAQRAAMAAAGDTGEVVLLTDEERVAAIENALANTAPDRQRRGDGLHHAGAAFDPCTWCLALVQSCAADCGRCGRCAGADLRRHVHRSVDRHWRNLPDLGHPVLHRPLRGAGGDDAAVAKRVVARGLPAAGLDRRGAWLDLGRDHQPDPRRGPWCGRCDHAGGLSQAERRERQIQDHHLGQFRLGDHDLVRRQFRPAHDA